MPHDGKRLSSFFIVKKAEEVSNEVFRTVSIKILPCSDGKKTQKMGQNRYNETDGFDGMIHTEVQSERRIVICRYSLRKIMTP